jgi:hypothetical protein
VYVAFFLAEYVGASRRAAKLRAKLVDRFHFGEGLTDEPIWWWIFEGRAREYQRDKKWTKAEVFLNVVLDGGGRYTGVLLYFPVVRDTEGARDLAIWKARYYEPGNDKPVELPPDDVVLLNSRDCRAIETRYLEARGLVPGPPPLAVQEKPPRDRPAPRA